MPALSFVALRRECGLTQIACAAMLGVRVQSVRNWERGAHRTPRSALLALSLWRHSTDALRAVASEEAGPLYA